MHIPHAYEMDSRQVRSFVVKNPFGHLITESLSGLRVTATPFIFETDADLEMTLVGHIAGRNRQALEMSENMKAVALLTGPDAYVSPRWYRVKPDLPTWNYVAVQIRGVLIPVDDLKERQNILARTITCMERGRAEPWSMDEATSGHVERLLPHIRAFRLRIERMEGARKLSQNKPLEERLNVIGGLQQTGEAGALCIASLMQRDAEREKAETMEATHANR
ncbi:FMN-binding negative transcriptional regulator [Nitratireductor aquibiodomus RA22]|uniref:FMN-binding negative transcriptional regulator n=2 Tax=Nitratireductor aquibiodomus TaxID=204799 RepID=I5BVE5_9HYPH|nr:FMN-binding negative transcriptional regulator [Nitratireductor aquibiodomus RA22]